LKAKAEGKENIDDDTTPTSTANSSLDFFDPRSPTSDIQRTPLALGEQNFSFDGKSGKANAEKDVSFNESKSSMSYNHRIVKP